MTRDTRKKISLGLLMTFGIPAVSVITAIGGARVELSQKADRSVVMDSIRALRSDAAIAGVRDSAWKATVAERLTEIACAQNPRRRYCQ